MEYSFFYPQTGCNYAYIYNQTGLYRIGTDYYWNPMLQSTEAQLFSVCSSGAGACENTVPNEANSTLEVCSKEEPEMIPKQELRGVGSNQQKSQQVRKHRGKPQLILQKENRNVYSNLLRQFFKNIIETRIYGQIINNTIEKYALNQTPNGFYFELESHRINFKNYVRLNKVKHLFTSAKSPQFSLLLRVILKDFLNNYCATHFLTSKRVGRASSKMHLQGVRSLRDELAKVY